ncbi:hypothetical protein [Pedobacter metabolipauper]|uniref:YXWGXW repeat-containing protein n=1 Tax=Pedobacter metabolipauper TaxID=425513 RepID=A0A4R6T1E5_9SPHI|nr:hypothetical protein [Pedobacter metabolipauper]TDQ11161.1 hypothetical protein ATK78_0276 [Pedobacter metabolipauper]
MRKLVLLGMLGFAATTALTVPAKAQINVSINIGSQPQWGPRGYDHVDYYYLPDVESYYYVPTKKFIYYSGNRWVHARNLPSRYRSYNLHSGRKYVINEPRPYASHHIYKAKYNAGHNWNGDRRHYSVKQKVYRSHNQNYRNNDNRSYRKKDDGRNHRRNNHNNRNDGRRGRG